MLKDLTELRIYNERKETLFDKYINSLLAGDIKILTIKEEHIMLEKLLEAREAYIAELTELKNTNLDLIKEARFEEVKADVVKSVEEEHNLKIAEIENKVAHYDFVIAEYENIEVAKAETEELAEPVENTENC